MTDTLQTAELLRQYLFDYNMNTTAGGMDEDKAINEFVTSVKALINSEVTKKLEAVLAVLPEKQRTGNPYGTTDGAINSAEAYGFNQCHDQVTTAITNLVEGSRASSRINPSVRTTLNTEGKSVA